MRLSIELKIIYKKIIDNVNSNVLLLFTGRMVQGLAAIVTLRVMTELLSASEVGNQYLINSIILWFSLVLINPVGMFINRHLHEWKKNNQLYFYINQINKYFLIIAVLSAPIIFIIKNKLSIGEGLPAYELALFVLMYVYFSTWFQTLVSFFNFFNFQKIFVFLNIFSQSAGLLFAILIVHVIKNDAISWMSGLLLAQIIALGAAVIIFKRKFANIVNTTHKTNLFSKTTLVFCCPVAITTLFMWFANNGYRLLIEKKMGIEAIAALGVGLGLATSLASIVESITTQYFYPTYYEKLLNSNIEKRSLAWQQLFKKTMSVYIPTAFLMISVTYLVVKVLTAQSFHHVSSYVFVGVIIEFFRQSSNVAYLVAHGEKKTNFTILPYFIGAVVLVILMLIFTLFFELNIYAVLFSLLAASLSTYVFNLFMVYKLINNKIEFRPLAKIFILSSPLLIPVFFFSTQDSLLNLIAVAILSITWYLALLYNQLTKITK